MPICNVIVILIVLRILIKDDKKNIFVKLWSLTIALALIHPQGYLIGVGENGFGSVSKFLGGVSFLYSIYYIYSRNIHISFTLMKNLNVYIWVVIVGILIELIYPYDGLLLPLQSGKGGWDEYVLGLGGNKVVVNMDIMYTLTLLVGHILYSCACLVMIKSICTRLDLILMINKVSEWIKVVIIYGLLELIIKNFFGFTDFMSRINDVLLGKGGNIAENASERIGDGLYTLRGMTSEPSHMVTSLFLFSICVIMLNKIYNDNPKIQEIIPKSVSDKWLFPAIILAIFSGGFSAILCIGTLLIIYFIIKKEFSLLPINVLAKRIIVLLMSFFILCALIYSVMMDFFPYFYNRLEDAWTIGSSLIANEPVLLSGHSGVGSTYARFFSIYDLGMSVADRPLFGLGLGLQWCHDILISMLSDIGVFGVIAWWRFVKTPRYSGVRYDSLIILMLFFIWGLPYGLHGAYSRLEFLFIIEATSIYMNGDNYVENLNNNSYI